MHQNLDRVHARALILVLEVLRCLGENSYPVNAFPLPVFLSSEHRPCPESRGVRRIRTIIPGAMLIFLPIEKRPSLVRKHRSSNLVRGRNLPTRKAMTVEMRGRVVPTTMTRVPPTINVRVQPMSIRSTRIFPRARPRIT